MSWSLVTYRFLVPFRAVLVEWLGTDGLKQKRGGLYDWNGRCIGWNNKVQTALEKSDHRGERLRYLFFLCF